MSTTLQSKTKPKTTKRTKKPIVKKNNSHLPHLKNKKQTFTVIEIWEDVYVVGNNNFTFKLSKFILPKLPKEETTEKTEGGEAQKKRRIPIPVTLELDKTYSGDIEKYQKKNLYRLLEEPTEVKQPEGKKTPINDKIVLGVYALILKTTPKEGEDNEILVLKKRNSLKFLISFKFKLRYELKKKVTKSEEEGSDEEEDDDIWDGDMIKDYLSHFLNEEVLFLLEFIDFYENAKVSKSEEGDVVKEEDSKKFLEHLNGTFVFTQRDKKIIKKSLVKLFTNQSLKFCLLSIKPAIVSEYEKRKGLKEEKNLSWGLPGGVPDKLYDRESFACNAKQEIKEKTKLVLNHHKEKNAVTKPNTMMFPISQIRPLFKHFTIFYLDNNDKRNEIQTKNFSDEFMDFKWVSLKEFKDLIPKLFEPLDEKSLELELDGWSKLTKWQFLVDEMKGEKKKESEDVSISSYGKLKIEETVDENDENDENETIDETIIDGEVKKPNEKSSSKKKKKSKEEIEVEQQVNIINDKARKKKGQKKRKKKKK